MEVILNVAIRLPIFSPPVDPNQHRSSTELRFSRWNNANAEKFNRRRRSLQEIEDEIRRTRRFNAADNITNTAVADSATDTFKSFGTPSAPSRPSIPGKKSKYSKPPPKPKPLLDWHPVVSRTESPEFQPGPENVKIGDDGVSYVVDGAPFEFRYSYTETPTAKPMKMREPPFAPFGPATLPRPWTGRNPVPPSKTTVKEFQSLVLPPATDEERVEPDQLAGPVLEWREKILGEPLTRDEIVDLVKDTEKSTSQLNIGRDGLTHNMLETIHTHWMRRRVCKIKCRGVCTVDMDKVCKQLEERTGGKVIYRQAGTVYLFRGRYYNYKMRPHFPLMRWKPFSPVYPRLIKRVPDGLTLEKATEMRQKGRNLIPIRKLAKNGVYWDLVTDVREAFEVCELVRINCQGLNTSDYRKIGAKLKDLVPCVLLSFENDHILMWMEQNWRSSLSDCGEDGKEANKVNVDSENSSTLPSDAQELSTPCLQKNPVQHQIQSNEHCDISISSNSDDISLCKVVPCPTENSSLSASLVTDAASLPIETYEVETAEDIKASSGEPQPCSRNTGPSVTVPGTCNNSINNFVDPRTDKLLDGSGADVSESSRSAPCTEGILLLLEQAVEKGIALVLDDESLDDDNIYHTTVAFAKSAPPEPVFKLPRKVMSQETDKEEGLTLEREEITDVTVKGEKMDKNSESERKEEFDGGCLNVVPRGTIKVDKLAILK